MIPANATNAVANQLQAAYARSTQPSVVQAVEATLEIQRLFAIGEEVRAKVNGLLPNGRFAVMVKDQLLDLNLPRNTELGDLLDLQVIANSPRLTFLLLQQGLLNRPSGVRQDSTDVDLSDTARFLGKVLAESDNGAKPTIQQTNALLLQTEAATGSHVINVEKLAQTLRQVLDESGLFYESHLAKWASDASPESLAAMLREPQGQLSTLKPTAEKLAQGQLPISESIEEQQPLTNTTSSTSPTLLKQLDEMPTHLRQMVQQQLQVLDQRALAWQGQAWPGQPLRWEVEADQSQSQQGDADTATNIWRTRLSVDLPNLGTMDILVSLTNRKFVDVKFSVSADNVAHRIREESQRLRKNLDNAGLELTNQWVDVVADTPEANSTAVAPTAKANPKGEA